MSLFDGIEDHDPEDGPFVTHGLGMDLLSRAVDTVAAGAMMVIHEPDNVDELLNDDPSMVTMIIKAKTMRGEEVELMLHPGQAALIAHAAVTVLDVVLQQKMETLDAPEDILNDIISSNKSLLERIVELGDLAALADRVSHISDLVNNPDLSWSEKMIRATELVDEILDDDDNEQKSLWPDA